MSVLPGFGRYPIGLWSFALILTALTPHMGRASTLTGVIASDGAPATGVMVTIKSEGKGIARTVVTGKDGRYNFNGLRVGDYTLRTRQIGFADQSTNIAVSEKGETVTDVALLAMETTIDQLPSAFVVNAFPDGVEKRKLILDCMGCHQFNVPIVYDTSGVLRDEEQWAASVKKMIAFCGPATMFPILPPDRLPEPTASFVANYLTEQNLNAQLSKLSSIGLESGAFTEYDLPESRDFPHDLMLDSQGNVLVTGMFSGAMYSLEPNSGEFTVHSIPTGMANPRALDVGKNGDWWIALGMPRKIAHYSVSGNAWKFYDIASYPHSVAIDGVGRVWFNGHFSNMPARIGFVDPQDSVVTKFEVPAGGMTESEARPIPYGLRVAPDGIVWGTELAGNRLIKFMPETGDFKVYDMPVAHSGPRRLDVGPDGMVWIPEYANNKLARFDPATEQFAEFELPTMNSLPYCVRVNPQSGIVWVTETANDAIARFDPKTERFVEYRWPSRVAFVRHIDVDPETGDVWGSYSQSPGVHPKVVRLSTE